MAGSAAETVIGAIVLVAAGGFLTFAAQTADLGAGAGEYILTADFRRADGIGAGTDIRVSGVKVGSVSSVVLDPQTYQARAVFSLEDDVLIPEDSDARIDSDGLLGGSYVAITPGASEFMLEEGGEILNTQGSVSLLDLILRFGAGNNAE